MVRKSKKVIETPEIIEETEENKDEIEEELIENTDETEETPDEITPVVTTNNNDIKEVLKSKKEISKKQREHLQKSREIMKKREQEKKHALKKFNELQKMNVNIDELIEQAKKLQVKRQYEELYGKSNNETILEKPTKVKKYESESESEDLKRQEKRQLTKQDILRNKLRGLF